MFEVKVPLNLIISVLGDAQRKYKEKNNIELKWQHSVVDLLKLLDVDSSLENRKRLFREFDGPFFLGKEVFLDDNAEMNQWLLGEVFKRITLKHSLASGEFFTH